MSFTGSGFSCLACSQSTGLIPTGGLSRYRDSWDEVNATWAVGQFLHTHYMKIGFEENSENHIIPNI